MKGWVVAGVLAAVGALVVAWLVIRGRTAEANRAAADMLVEWHRQSVASTRKRIEQLRADFENNQPEIHNLNAQLRLRKLRLAQEYQDRGLKADEIAARFARIDL